jgi:hypothetical protein
MARYIVETTVTVGGFTYQKGMTAELSSAQVSAIGASNLRAANNPGGTQTVSYAGGATSSSGIQVASQTHDTAGEAAGASNSS